MPGAAFALDDEAILPFEQAAQAVPENRVVHRDDDPDWRCAWHWRRCGRCCAVAVIPHGFPASYRSVNRYRYHEPVGRSRRTRCIPPLSFGPFNRRASTGCTCGFDIRHANRRVRVGRRAAHVADARRIYGRGDSLQRDLQAATCPSKYPATAAGNALGHPRWEGQVPKPASPPERLTSSRTVGPCP